MTQNKRVVKQNKIKTKNKKIQNNRIKIRIKNQHCSKNHKNNKLLQLLNQIFSNSNKMQLL